MENLQLRPEFEASKLKASFSCVTNVIQATAEGLCPTFATKGE